jgi:hypothetical protein
MAALGGNYAATVEIFLFFTASRFALESKQQYIQGTGDVP